MNKTKKQAHTYTHARKRKFKERKWWLLVTIQVFDFTKAVFHHQCFVYGFQNSNDQAN